MVMARTNDACVEGFSPALRLRFLYSDVSETVRTLQDQHGNCARSASVLGRAIAGMALVGIDLGNQDEILTLHVETDGRIGGFLVEMSGRGRLRGYTYEKNLDAAPPGNPGIPDPMGNYARVKITRSHESGGLRSQMSFTVSPSSEVGIFKEFYNSSLQIPTETCLSATSFENRIERVRALAVQRMPDARKTDFKRISTLFTDGTVSEQLEFDASLSTLREVLNVPDLMTGPTRALRFGCTCSQEVADGTFSSRTKPELDALVRIGSAQQFRCHVCGRVYTLPPEKIAQLAKNK